MVNPDLLFDISEEITRQTGRFVNEDRLKSVISYFEREAMKHLYAVDVATAFKIENRFLIFDITKIELLNERQVLEYPNCKFIDKCALDFLFL